MKYRCVIASDRILIPESSGISKVSGYCERLFSGLGMLGTFTPDPRATKRTGINFLGAKKGAEAPYLSSSRTLVSSKRAPHGATVAHPYSPELHTPRAASPHLYSMDGSAGALHLLPVLTCWSGHTPYVGRSSSATASVLYSCLSPSVGAEAPVD